MAGGQTHVQKHFYSIYIFGHFRKKNGPGQFGQCPKISRFLHGGLPLGERRKPKDLFTVFIQRGSRCSLRLSCWAWVFEFTQPPPPQLYSRMNSTAATARPHVSGFSILSHFSGCLVFVWLSACGVCLGLLTLSWKWRLGTRDKKNETKHNKGHYHLQHPYFGDYGMNNYTCQLQL